MPDIFLSYSRDDQVIARKFADAFERAGFSVWWDQALKSGIDYDKATEEALRGAKAVVVLWSKQSVGSRWVRTEATIALQNQTLVPVTIESCQRPIMFELTQTADLSHWSGDANDQVWLTFLHDVQQFVSAGTGAAANKSPLTRMTGAATKRRTSRVAWSLCALFALIAAGASFIALQHLRETSAPPPPETRVEINTPATSFPGDFALSPDGRQLVFVAAGDGEQRLWLRSLATTTAQPLPGTERARNPFWSPDSQAIGFFTESGLKKFELTGSKPQTLAPITTTARSRGSWSRDGIILFSLDVSSPLMQVSASGGTVTKATTLQPLQLQHLAPFFLPDGQHFLFATNGPPDISGIFLAKLDGTAPVRLLPANTNVVYIPSGWLLWVQGEDLTAQRLDVEQAMLTGEPQTLASGVASISAATTGLLAYRSVASQRQLTWVDREGTELGTIGEPDATISSPQIAPDGERVVVSRVVQNNADLWLLDGARSSRLTFDIAADEFPLWSADGTRIVFRSYRSGIGDLYIKPANAAGVEELLLGSDQLKIASSWSADGRLLMYFSISTETASDLWLLPQDGDQIPAVVQQTRFQEVFGVFSPDGRWVAFQSNESGRNEIYLRPFVAPGAEASALSLTERWQVSTAGGIMPVWSHDGRELYYLNPKGDMMAAPINATDTTVEPGTPVTLFPAQVYGGGVDSQIGRQYDVAPDGRFLINRVIDADSDAPIILIQNWNPEASQ